MISKASYNEKTTLQIINTQDNLHNTQHAKKLKKKESKQWCEIFNNETKNCKTLKPLYKDSRDNVWDVKRVIYKQST